MQTRERQLVGVIGFIIVAGIAIAVLKPGKKEPGPTESAGTGSSITVIEQAQVSSMTDESFGALLANVSEEPASSEGASTVGTIQGPTNVELNDERLTGAELDDAIEGSRPEEVGLSDPAPPGGTGTDRADEQPTATEVKYTVKPGDSLARISKNYYGTEARWKEILQANKHIIQSHSDLRPNMVLNIPKVQEVQARAGEQPSSARPALSASTTAGRRVYVVKKGDTLSEISTRCYKTSRRWREILKANSSKLSRPEDIRPGMKLLIP